MTTMKVVKLAIEDVLDLHTFRPKDIPDLLEDYFTECLKAGIYSVRIIHGKGKGIQKKRVQGLLEKNSMVTAFKDAPPEAGGWGATLVELSRNLDPEHSKKFRDVN
jgi:DNA-nicking Smr family endonuclease